MRLPRRSLLFAAVALSVVTLQTWSPGRSDLPAGPETTAGDPEQVLQAYRAWAAAHEQAGGDRQVEVALGWSKALSRVRSEATGRAELDLVSGRVRVEVDGLAGRADVLARRQPGPSAGHRRARAPRPLSPSRHAHAAGGERPAGGGPRRGCLPRLRRGPHGGHVGRPYARRRGDAFRLPHALPAALSRPAADAGRPVRGSGGPRPASHRHRRLPVAAAAGRPRHRQHARGAGTTALRERDVWRQRPHLRHLPSRGEQPDHRRQLHRHPAAERSPLRGRARARAGRPGESRPDAEGRAHPGERGRLRPPRRDAQRAPRLRPADVRSRRPFSTRPPSHPTSAPAGAGTARPAGARCATSQWAR